MPARKSPSVTPEQQRRKAESSEAKKSAARRDSPQDIAEGALMKRQSKQMHKQDGK